MKVITRLEFKLAKSTNTDQHVSHYARRTPPEHTLYLHADIWAHVRQYTFVHIFVYIYIYIYIYVCVCVCVCTQGWTERFIGWKVHMMTSYEQWDASTAIPMEEVWETEGMQCWKISLIWPYSMRVSWSVYESFSRLSHIRMSVYVFRLVLLGWVLWHINFCWLFNVKSIFNTNKLFYFRQISLSIQKQFNFKQFSLAQVRSLNVKTVLFQTIQLSISRQFRFHLTHRQDPIRRYHSGPEWTWEQWQ